MSALAVPALPTAEESQEASAALEALRNVFPEPRPLEARTIKIQADGVTETVTVPRPAFELFLQVLRQMSEGNAVTIVPHHAELTTQQAADFLNVSRPFVVGLIENSQLPARRVGNRRRIRFEDLLAYKEADDNKREQAMSQLAAEAQNLGIEY